MNTKRTSSPAPIEAADCRFYAVQTHTAGPQGALPLDADYLRTVPSGDLFGLTMDAGMGWPAGELRHPEYLILGITGGMRAEDGAPLALGLHSGHWETDRLMRAAAETFAQMEAVPFAAYLTDPCDGRTQGTPGMMDSLAYRNDAAIVLRRLIRSLPTRRGVLGIATCDKALPAMMMALAAQRDEACVLVPGGVTLLPTVGEDLGKVQTLSARFAQGEITLEEAAVLGCRACASPGGGCQFLGTAATSQVVSEALGMALVHSALAPSGSSLWLDLARRSAEALVKLAEAGVTMHDIVTADALHNAMIVYAAFGGSTNLLLHLPAVAHAAGLPRPTVADWDHVNRITPRLVDVLPNGPVGHPTVRVYLAGGVPEVMLHLRDLGLLRLDALTVQGCPLGESLEVWERSERRHRLREQLFAEDGIDPDTVIFSPQEAKARGITSTLTFPTGNLAPAGSVVKSTAIDPSVVDADGVYRKTGPARVFTTERAAIAAIKGQSAHPVRPGDVIVLIGRGPLGCGMEETYQVTSALKHISWGKEVALVTDARFSGVSTGACIGHVGPEALAGGPIGRVQEGDLIEIVIDRVNLHGSVNLVGHDGRQYSPEEGARVLDARPPHPDLAPDPALPDDTRLWAALQQVSGGTWSGCVYDVEAIVSRLRQ
ncbi:MAG TPA: YjhG/YagF family D-xylonate dehydratase [Anaerolineae bacterium]|nr:YjhG/YagF family D-xylonate dehydratase [Anaerolineae bacterium]HQI85591.1 YjhG/YagF family D-xylonate dehydratase [Anaerolineae bacterium]